MNRGIVWLPSAFRLAAILGGGKTPAHWGRDLARRTAGLTTVRRGSAWVEEFGVTHPRLCEGPLLGYTLSALSAGLVESMQDTQPDTARSRRGKFSRRESLLESNQYKVTARDELLPQFRASAINQSAQAKRKVLEAGLMGNLTTDPRQTQAQAELGLLTRLAGNKPPSKSGEQSPSSSKKGKHNIALQGMESGQTAPFSVEGKRNEPPFPSDYQDSSTQQHWLNRLAQRAGTALNHGQERRLEPTETAKSTSDNERASGQALLLMEQWTMPLGGMRASQDMLNQLIQENLPRGEASRGPAAQHHFTRGQPSFLDKPRSLPSRAGSPNNLTDGADNFEPSTELADTAQVARTFFALEPRTNEPAGSGENESKSSVPAVPPNLTPLLPSLLPPGRADIRPLPVAAATARQGAREEEMLATDGLDALADKIKLILDEQARRHGIDV